MVTVIGVDEFGGPEKLKAFDIPAQPVGSGHVRVDVAAAAVSPTDTIHRSGGRAELLEQDPPPYVPGMDIAGVINEIGEGVDHVAVGDAVMGIVAPRPHTADIRHRLCFRHVLLRAHRRGHLQSRHALFR